MFRLLRKLYKIRLLTPAGLFHLLGAIFNEGVNLMTLLHFSTRLHGRKTAVTDEKESHSYQELYERSQKLAVALQTNYDFQAKQKAAFICRNETSLISAIFAVSRLGADVYLLNPEMTAAQFSALHKRHFFDFLIYDSEVSALIDHSQFEGRSIIAGHDIYAPPENSAKTKPEQISKIKRIYGGNIVVLTGGTTGEPKTARRKPSLVNFLSPFFALLTELNLDRYQSAYIATPIFHGFGLAAVFIGLILGNRLFLISRFDARKGCELIEQYQIQTVTLVPLMLQRFLNYDTQSLKSLDCIISGGASLNPALVEETFGKLGDKLFNLYGTSEAGFSVLATPADLRRASNTIGRKIPGLDLRILDGDDQELADGEVGRICIKSRWSVKDSGNNWIETGDLGYRDEAGCYFLCGRNDEMIVSGGENVYPVELENILGKHPKIRQVAVIGVPDAEFGQRLKAFVAPAAGAVINEAEITGWLSGRVARFQMPVAIEFLQDLPVTAIGKINKKILV